MHASRTPPASAVPRSTSAHKSAARSRRFPSRAIPRRTKRTIGVFAHVRHDRARRRSPAIAIPAGRPRARDCAPAETRHRGPMIRRRWSRTHRIVQRDFTRRARRRATVGVSPCTASLTVHSDSHRRLVLSSRRATRALRVGILSAPPPRTSPRPSAEVARAPPPPVTPARPRFFARRPPPP